MERWEERSERWWEREGAAGAAGTETEAALTLMVKGSFLLYTGGQSCVCASILMLSMLRWIEQFTVLTDGCIYSYQKTRKNVFDSNGVSILLS